MIKVFKMPLYRINTDIIDKDQIGLNQEKVHGKLEDFLAKDSSLRHGNIKIGYNNLEIKVLCDNLWIWDEKVHNNFCDKFNVILFQVESEDKLTTKENSFRIIYTYIPKFVKQEYNEEYKLDFRYILAKYP